MEAGKGDLNVEFCLLFCKYLRETQKDLYVKYFDETMNVIDIEKKRRSKVVASKDQEYIRKHKTWNNDNGIN